MRRRSAPAKLPALGDFGVRKQFAATDPAAWRLIREWQRDRLIKVEAITAQAAWIELTDRGREAIAP